MTRKSGTEQTMREIKRELKPFTDFFDELDKAAKRAEREKQYKKQLQEEKYEKWERRLNWLSDKINKHKGKTFSNNVTYNELEDWQKEEVDSGNYDETAFEEEELEDDDYYSEDD